MKKVKTLKNSVTHADN